MRTGKKRTGCISERHKTAIAYAIKEIKKSDIVPFVEDLILFGSCARKEESWNSDVDLCLVLDPSAKSLPDLSRKIHLLKGTISEPDLLAAETDLKVVIGKEWEDSNMLFFQTIKKGGVSVWQ